MKHLNIISLSFLFGLCISSCGDFKRPKDFVNKEKIINYVENKAVETINNGVDKLAKEIDNSYNDVENNDSEILLPAPLVNVEEQIMHKTAYVVSYNNSTRTPNYVAWILTSKHTTGPFKRGKIPFHVDEEVDGVKVDTYDYMNSGYDRGHMCPSADNKWSEKAQEESFLMTNICPQEHSLNAGDWKELEDKCRDWANQFGAITIVCGPINPQKNARKIGKNKVVVPVGFFKVVLCTNGRPKAIGFIYPNDNKNVSIDSYATTIDEVEKITGIDFFKGLSSNVEKHVESKYNLMDWGL